MPAKKTKKRKPIKHLIEKKLDKELPTETQTDVVDKNETPENITIKTNSNNLSTSSDAPQNIPTKNTAVPIEKLPLETESINIPAVDSTKYTTDDGVFWNSKTGKIWMLLFVMSIIIAIAAGIFIYKEGTIKMNLSNQSASSSSPSTISVPTNSSPTATPTPEVIDLSKYEIEVLNGSGIPGEAAKTKDVLEKEEFKVVSIGNADELDSQKTIIQSKKIVPRQYLDKLRSLLEKSYVLDETTELSDDQKSDLIITIGNQKTQ